MLLSRQDVVVIVQSAIIELGKLLFLVVTPSSHNTNDKTLKVLCCANNHQNKIPEGEGIAPFLLNKGRKAASGTFKHMALVVSSGPQKLTEALDLVQFYMVSPQTCPKALENSDAF